MTLNEQQRRQLANTNAPPDGPVSPDAVFIANAIRESSQVVQQNSFAFENKTIAGGASLVLPVQDYNTFRVIYASTVNFRISYNGAEPLGTGSLGEAQAFPGFEIRFEPPLNIIITNPHGTTEQIIFLLSKTVRIETLDPSLLLRSDDIGAGSEPESFTRAMGIERAALVRPRLPNNPWAERTGSTGPTGLVALRNAAANFFPRITDVKFYTTVGAQAECRLSIGGNPVWAMYTRTGTDESHFDNWNPCRELTNNAQDISYIVTCAATVEWTLYVRGYDVRNTISNYPI